MLADRLAMPDLQNAVGTLLRRMIRNTSLADLEEFMNLAYSQTPEGETYLLEQLVRFRFYVTSGEELRDCPYQIHPEPVRALTVGTANREFDRIVARWNRFGMPPYNPTQGVIDWSSFAEYYQEDAYPNPPRR